MEITFLSPILNVLFVLAVVAFFVTTFWDSIKENHGLIKYVRYFLSAAIVSYSIYCFGQVDGQACGVTFIGVGIILFIATIAISMEGWSQKILEKVIRIMIIFIPVLMAILLFIWGSGIYGFQVVASLGLLLVLVPKKS